MCCVEKINQILNQFLLKSKPPTSSIFFSEYFALSTVKIGRTIPDVLSLVSQFPPLNCYSPSVKDNSSKNLFNSTDPYLYLTGSNHDHLF